MTLMTPDLRSRAMSKASAAAISGKRWVMMTSPMAGLLPSRAAATGSMDRIALFALEPAQTFDVRAMRAEHHAPSSLADSLVQCFSEAARALSDALPQRLERTAFALGAAAAEDDAD